jgi:hypothetical protein
MCLRMFDKQTIFHSFTALKCLNTRLFILFEHTNYILIQLVLVKDLFQTKKRNCFFRVRLSTFSDILIQQHTLARTIFSLQTIIGLLHLISVPPLSRTSIFYCLTPLETTEILSRHPLGKMFCPIWNSV